MLEEINQKLFDLKEQVRIRDKNKSSLNEINSLIESETDKFERLKESLEKEHSDVEKLEGVSLASVFHSIIGDKADVYEKEKQEYLAVKLKFDNSFKTLGILKTQKINLEKELEKNGEVEKEYLSLLAEKEKIVLNSNNPNTQRISESLNKINSIKTSIKEVKEAVSAGEDLKSTLYKIIDYLKEAQGWGTWDMLGGGIISTAIKHGKIDSARSEISVAQVQMRRFSKELVDTGSAQSLSIEIGGFETFADYFFDNFITDIMVQSKINASLEHTNQAFYNVMSIIDGLNEQEYKFSEELLKAESEHKSIIETA